MRKQTAVKATEVERCKPCTSQLEVQSCNPLSVRLPACTNSVLTGDSMLHATA